MLLKKEEVIKMFQNINETEKTKEEIGRKKSILANVISKKYIILYIVTIMVSMVNMNYSMSPFSLAIIAACISNEIPIIAVTGLAFIGNAIFSGVNGSISFIVTLLIFFASFFIKEPKYNDSSRNEKVMLSKRIFFSSLIVSVVKIFIKQFLLYDLLLAISMSIVIVIFYKIFANSLAVITSYNEKMAFSIEEVLGTSLLLSIALCSLGNLSVFGFSIRNVLSIFIVLVLGWKNGVLIGTTAGATIGVTLGIIANNEPIVVASYAISGMIAGILNRFGKIGVILGFILGNIVLSYVANGMVENVILFKEILIAGIALLAVPKGINLNIENIIGNNKFLPVGNSRGLNRSKETVSKLNNVSKVVKDMADNYKNVAATAITKEDIQEKNKQKFIAELLNNIEYMNENILYETIEDVDGKIIDDIFIELMDKQFIKENDLLRILARNNNYVVGFDQNNEKITRDVEKMTEAINSAFRISKMNFIWSIRLNEEKKNFENQLNGVSKAISEIADEMEENIEEDDSKNEIKEQITLLLKQKEILVQEILINKKENDRYKIELCIEKSDKEDLDEIITEIINKVIGEKVIIKERKDIKRENIITYKVISDDKYILDIGCSNKIKDNMSVSGDSILKTKLKDGKYLLAISDGILDSNIEYKNKELWIKYLLEDINVVNPQKIADIILNESVDNNFGKIKDDMSVLVCKLIKKQ